MFRKSKVDRKDALLRNLLTGSGIERVDYEKLSEKYDSGMKKNCGPMERLVIKDNYVVYLNATHIRTPLNKMGITKEMQELSDTPPQYDVRECYEISVCSYNRSETLEAEWQFGTLRSAWDFIVAHAR